MPGMPSTVKPHMPTMKVVIVVIVLFLLVYHFGFNKKRG